MDFVYVEDVARATVLAMKSDASDVTINIAAQKETSLKELCAALLMAMEADLQPRHEPIPEERKSVEVTRRLADTTRARELIGFTPDVMLDSGLKKLVDWLGSLPN